MRKTDFVENVPPIDLIIVIDANCLALSDVLVDIRLH